MITTSSPFRVPRMWAARATCTSVTILRMAHPDFQELVDAAMPFAQQMLEKYVEFFPFAFAMNVSGAVVAVAAYDGNERPSALETIDLLYESLRRSDDLRALAVCMDIRTIAPGETVRTDAICVQLEHRDADPIHVILPYAKRWLRKPRYGEIFATAGAARVFGLE